MFSPVRFSTRTDHYTYFSIDTIRFGKDKEVKSGCINTLPWCRATQELQPTKRLLSTLTAVQQAQRKELCLNSLLELAAEKEGAKQVTIPKMESLLPRVLVSPRMQEGRGREFDSLLPGVWFSKASQKKLILQHCTWGGPDHQPTKEC